MTTVNLKDLAYQVKTKTGKITYFSGEEQAREFAKARSNNRHTYVVWHEGKAICAYVNGKQLRDYVTVFEKHYAVNKPYDDVRHSEQLVAIYVQVCANETVRYTEVIRVISSILIKRTGKLRNISSLKSISYTVHQHGIVYKKDIRGRVYVLSKWCPFYTQIHTDGITAFIAAVSKLLPDRAWLMDTEAFRAIGLALLRYANKYCVVDTYNKTCFPRTHVSFLHTKRYDTILNNDKYIGALCENNNVPYTKALKKYFLNSAGNVDFVKRALDCGMREISNIIATINFWARIWCHDKDVEGELIKRLIELKGETWVTKALLLQSHQDLTDAIRVMHGYNLDANLVEYVLSNAKNLREIHENLVWASRSRCCRKNIQIPYSDNEKNMECVIENVHFELPKDAQALAVIGAQMGICVGGYAHAAAQKQCTIVAMRVNNKYVGCIELRGKEMVQLKARFNNLLEECYRAAVSQWVSEYNIDTRRCYDYAHIGMPWLLNIRYDYIMPQEYEKHEEALRIIRCEPRELDPFEADKYSWYEKDEPQPKWHERHEYELVETDDDEMPF